MCCVEIYAFAKIILQYMAIIFNPKWRFIFYIKNIPVKKLHFLFLLLPLTVNAQKKVDLDPFKFTAQFRTLPAMVLDSSYHTYNVTIEATKLTQPLLREIDPENSVMLRGWRKLPTNGHITVSVKLDDVLPETVSVKERTQTTKDKSGAVITKTFYYEQVQYTFAANAIINDYKGMHIMDQPLADRQYKLVYNSPEFAFKPMAEGYFAINAIRITKDLYRRSVTNAMHYLSERLTDNFGFDEVTVHDKMWIVDSRKHPEYEAHRNAFQKIKEVLFSMSANEPIDKAKQDLKPVIDYFEKIKTDYSTMNKHDRKIRYASYYNLAVLYYYLDDPQSMMKEASGLILNDFDSNDGKAFEQTAMQLKNIFQNTQINSRHFTIDINKFKGPFENNVTGPKK